MKLFQVELGSFLKIGESFFDRFTLRGRARLGVQRSESTCCGRDEYSSKRHIRPPTAPSKELWRVLRLMPKTIKVSGARRRANHACEAFEFIYERSGRL